MQAVAEVAKMWNKLSIRIKVTLLTAAVLCIISLLLFIFNVENAANIFIIPDNVDVPFNSDASFSFDFDIAQRIFRTNSFYTLIIFSVAGTVLMWWVVGKVLIPLNKFSKEIKKLDITKINDDIHIVKSTDELGDLQNAFNYMLGNIRDSYERQKRFSQNAAHELKTPVAAIRANLEVLYLDDEPKIEEYKEFVEVVNRQIEMMNSIVTGLRLLSNKESLNLEKVRLYRIINEIVEDLKDKISEKNQTVKLVFDNRDMTVEADRVLIKQAVFNIVHNAVRYSRENAFIEIQLRKSLLSIKNHGESIPKESLEKIFEAFYCVDKSRAKKYGGSGLGLAIVKEIMDRHGFSINANSVENEFVEFIIDFKG